jgi:zinc protease
MNRSKIVGIWLTIAALAVAVSAGAPGGPAAAAKAGKGSTASFQIKYEKYTLPNGLEVVLHEDHSDPIVAVATVVHVGSNREKPGRTGFAHFFEHMSFNDSENTPRGANRKLIPELGGQRNGGTSPDGTIYYEVVPKDAFEKILWIDSDRLGFMINTVTEAALEREKQVVKNEKRQIVDNAPYGYTDEVQRAALYPADHPYHWTTIGSLPDLQSATLADVKEFYDRFYGAANATLVIAGDIDIAETKRLVERWFGEIRRGPDVSPIPPAPTALAESKSFYHDDNFAKLPEIQIIFPTVAQYQGDDVALEALASLLAGSKKAALYKTIVEERKLAPEVNAYQNSMEIAGEFGISIRANEGVDLDSVKVAIDEALARFERDGVSESELRYAKAQYELALSQQLETILNKAFQLAYSNEYSGDPGRAAAEAERYSKLTPADIMNVFHRYLKGRPYVMTSFVPKGQPQLAVEGARKAEIWQEAAGSSQQQEEVSAGEEAQCEKTPTKYDRSEPPLGAPPLLRAPAVWTGKLSNGLALYGIEQDEVPLVRFELMVRGGRWLDPADKIATAELMSRLMMEGTEKRRPAELEEAIGLLGASITTAASDEEILVTGTTLARNFEATIDIVTEMLLEPRWDETEFARIKQEFLTRFKAYESNPNQIASTVYRRLLYGDAHPKSRPIGTPEGIAAISIDDLKQYYARNFSPSVATFQVAGDVTKDRVLKSLKPLGRDWNRREVAFLSFEVPAEHGGRIFFVDRSGAKQSMIFAGHLALAATDDDYNNLVYANEVLGTGSSGRLFQLLRLEKGFTYGAYSRVDNRLEIAPITMYTSVRTNATLESLELIRKLVSEYRATFGEKELATTKNMVIKRGTLEFESLTAKRGMLGQIAKYRRPANYIELDQRELMGLGLADFHRVIDKYLDEKDMIYVVVGDAASQRAGLDSLGIGAPVPLDVYGNRAEGDRGARIE